MPLVNRLQRTGHSSNYDNDVDLQGDSEPDDKMKPPRSSFFIVIGVALLLHIGGIVGIIKGRLSPDIITAGSDRSYIYVERVVAKDTLLRLRFLRSSDTANTDSSQNVNLVDEGPHEVELHIDAMCKFPAFWIRLIGDALVRIDLRPDHADGTVWKGSFTIPMAGTYAVDTRWYDCTNERTSWTTLSEPILVTSNQKNFYGSTTDPIFAESLWVSTGDAKNGDLSSYVWKKPVKEDLSREGTIRIRDTVVVINGTAKEPHRFYEFHDLGNYELLCFMGSKTMSDIRDKFLDLRPHLFPGQRPFKFHYYNVTDFVHPDKYWDTSTKERVRKCKHILLLVEPDMLLSQSQYKDQLTTFVGHLLKLMPDKTFPIRLFTLTEPVMTARNCHVQNGGVSTSDHPCNEAIKDLITANTFEERVHLLDNTDLSAPQFDERRDDILAVIALRIYVIVGKQVAEWRAIGQKGLIDGLHRNGVVEPNFKLVPYEGWA